MHTRYKRKGVSFMNVKKVRDLTLISLDKDKTLVVACDSSGSIGSKKMIY